MQPRSLPGPEPFDMIGQPKLVCVAPKACAGLACLAGGFHPQSPQNKLAVLPRPQPVPQQNTSLSHGKTQAYLETQPSNAKRNPLVRPTLCCNDLPSFASLRLRERQHPASLILQPAVSPVNPSLRIPSALSPCPQILWPWPRQFSSPSLAIQACQGVLHCVLSHAC